MRSFPIRWEDCAVDVEESADVAAPISDELPEEVFEAACDADAGTDDFGSDAAMPIDADDLKLLEDLERRIVEQDNKNE